MNRLLLIGCFCVLGIEGFRLWWFHGDFQSDRWSGQPRLILREQEMERNTPLRSFPVHEYVETGGLHFDSARFFRLGENPPNSPPYSLLFMEYRQGNENIWNDLFTHPPEVCMRSSGCAFEGALPSRMIPIGGQDVPMRILKYSEPVTGAPLYLFKLVWLPEASPISPRTDKPEKRPLWIQMALSRIQTPPGAVLLARVRGVDDPEKAWDIVSRQMLPYLQLGE